MVKKFFEDSGDEGRTTVLVPSTAHGTNPATATMADFGAKEIGLDEHGCVDVDELKEMVDETTAALMITNPNTCGVFERNIKEISEILHEAGAFLYMDGANMNANLGPHAPRRGRRGRYALQPPQDVLHPPRRRRPRLRRHRLLRSARPLPAGPRGREEGGDLQLLPAREEHRARGGFHGNFGQMLRAWNYIKMHGPDLRDVTDMAVLNANYVRARLGGTYQVPYDELCKHEVVVQPPKGMKALDIAKGLIDHGYHPPTIYFPLVVKEAMLIEPTETESKETLDDFVGALWSSPRADPRTSKRPRPTPQPAASTRPAPPASSRPGGRRWLTSPSNGPRSTTSTRRRAPASSPSRATRCPSSTRA
jgi:glycine dehydrogenase subunit 2